MLCSHPFSLMESYTLVVAAARELSKILRGHAMQRLPEIEPRCVVGLMLVDDMRI